MAAKKDRNKSLFSLVESEFNEEIHEGNTGLPSKTKNNLISKLGNLILYWSETKKCIYSSQNTSFIIEADVDDDKIEVNSHKNDEKWKKIKFQTLICSVSPAFPITSIKCSKDGRHALIFGPNTVGVIELPRRWGDGGLFENGKKTIHCRLTLLDDSFFMHHMSTKILQASWYNGSPTNSHVVVLCSDNCLRFYDTTKPEQPIVRLPLFDQTESTRVGSLASIASAVLGTNGVDFEQGEVVYDDGVDTYPIYVMQENGDVWVVKCRFSQNRFLVNQQGPLTMNPPSQDNYGCNYCSLICLGSNPTIVVMATESGCIHHCLVMESNAEESDDEVRLTRSSILMDPCEALYVYESVQLELTFLDTQAEDEDQNKKLSNLRLEKDALKKDSYFVISDGGLHAVHLPWMNELEQYMFEDLLSSSAEIESPADISYLLCTQPSEESPQIAIYGSAVLMSSSLEPYISCLLSTGQFIRLNFIRNVRNMISGTTSRATNKQEYMSPLRKLKGVGGFDTYIASILTKNATVPLMRTGGGDQKIPADTYYKLLTKATQILRDEYMQKMLQAKGELEKRCKLLRMKKEEQLDELRQLQDNSNLIKKGEELASKLETAQENMHSITERIGQVLRNIQTSSPVLSTDEIEWTKELKVMKEKMIKMKRFSEVIHTKHENFILQSIPQKTLPNKTLNTSASLSASQAIKVRAVLKEQGTAISGLVEDVQNLSLRVG